MYSKEEIIFIVVIGITVYGLIFFTAIKVYKIKRREQEDEEQI